MITLIFTSNNSKTQSYNSRTEIRSCFKYGKNQVSKGGKQCFMVGVVFILMPYFGFAQNHYNLNKVKPGNNFKKILDDLISIYDSCDAKADKKTWRIEVDHAPAKKYALKITKSLSFKDLYRSTAENIYGYFNYKDNLFFVEGNKYLSDSLSITDTVKKFNWEKPALEDPPTRTHYSYWTYHCEIKKGLYLHEEAHLPCD